MKITIVGAGAMGSLMAARLTLAMQAQSREPGAAPEIERVLLYGRDSDHLNEIRKHGLELTERDGQRSIVKLDVTSTPADISGSDLVVVLVKAWATASAVAPLKPYLTRESVVLTLQNGLGNASQIRTALLSDKGSRPHVWLGVTTQAAIRTAPGKVRHTGSGLTAIGRRSTLVHEHLSNLAATLTEADWRTVAVEDIHRWVWRKLAINAAINPLTALARVPNRAVNTDPDLWQAAISVVSEVVQVGAAQGVRLNQQQIIDGIEEVTRATGDDRSSMLIDLENAMRTEIEGINGQVVRYARRHNVPVPTNDLLLRLVRAHEHGHRPATGTKEDSSYGGELDEAIRG